jgi:Holliday junction DNA helicase RuvA
MIAYIEGTIQSTGTQHVIVVVNNIGYKVHVLQSLLFTAGVGTTAALHTHQHVREDALELYGFERPEELKMFEALIGISGVGPKTALGILSITTPEQLRTAVASGNIGLLTKVSGVGRKTAERLVLELKDTFAVEEKARGEKASTLYESDLEVIDALESLGYSRTEARQAIEALPKDVTETEARLKAALKSLGNGKHR